MAARLLLLGFALGCTSLVATAAPPWFPLNGNLELSSVGWITRGDARIEDGQALLGLDCVAPQGARTAVLQSEPIPWLARWTIVEFDYFIDASDFDYDAILEVSIEGPNTPERLLDQFNPHDWNSVCRVFSGQRSLSLGGFSDHYGVLRFSRVDHGINELSMVVVLDNVQLR